MKNKILLTIGIITMLLLVVGASYAYFAINTTNNFGTHTISSTMGNIGSVSLVSTGNQIRLNLTSENMMKKTQDVYYYGTISGTPVTNLNSGLVEIGQTSVIGEGTYDCEYTLNITAAGTNNMYTTFQSMSEKSNDQIGFGIGDYDSIFNRKNRGFYINFYESNAFPAVRYGLVKNVSSTNPIVIYGYFSVVNRRSINQTALAGTDIIITPTVTSFTCKLSAPLEYAYKYYDNIAADVETIDNTGLVAYLKGMASVIRGPWAIQYTYNGNQYYLDGLYETENLCLNNVGTDQSCIQLTGETLIDADYNELCIVLNNTTVCIPYNSWDSASTYYSELTSLGAYCNSDYQQAGELTCTNYSTESETFNHEDGILIKAIDRGDVDYLEKNGGCSLYYNGRNNCYPFGS